MKANNKDVKSNDKEERKKERKKEENLHGGKRFRWIKMTNKGKHGNLKKVYSSIYIYYFDFTLPQLNVK